MLFGLQMPQMGEDMRWGVIRRVLVQPGARVELGTRLVEVEVDLSEVAEQNCAPISWFLIVAAESGWLRKMDGAAGDRRDVGSLLAIVSREEAEPLDGNRVDRPLRVNIAGICT